MQVKEIMTAAAVKEDESEHFRAQECHSAGTRIDRGDTRSDRLWRGPTPGR